MESFILKKQREDIALLKARTDAIAKLRFIVFCMFACTVVNLIYSVCVDILYDAQCYPQHIPLWLDSVFSFLLKLDAYFIWYWPLIFLFWPTRRHVTQQKRIEKVIYRKFEKDSQNNELYSSQERRSMVQYRPKADRTTDSSSSDDAEYNFGPVG